MTERPAPPSRARIDVLLDEADRRDALHEATLQGLRDTQKHVPAIWLYDERGSLLFDEITRLTEYYLTRAEREDPRRAGARGRVRDASGDPRRARIGDVGEDAPPPGRARRSGTLSRFTPLDVSEEVLIASAHAIAREYPDVRVHAVVGDFERHLSALPAGERRLFVFLGSTIGGLTIAARERFLRAVATSLGAGDALLLGLDLVKDPARIEAAYSDNAGLSERFQRNGLANLDRELGSSFSRARFEHSAAWDPERELVDIGFRSVGAQVVAVPELGIEVAFVDGELLRTGVSSKFRRGRI